MAMPNPPLVDAKSGKDQTQETLAGMRYVSRLSLTFANDIATNRQLSLLFHRHATTRDHETEQRKDCPTSFAPGLR